MTTPLLHVALLEEWRAAQTSGRYDGSTRGATFAEVGFVHCATPQQVPGVLARFYAGVTEPLVVLELDPSRIAADGVEVRWEPPAPGAVDFPHVYAPLDPRWVVRELPPDQLPRGSA